MCQARRASGPNWHAAVAESGEAIPERAKHHEPKQNDHASHLLYWLPLPPRRRRPGKEGDSTDDPANMQGAPMWPMTAPHGTETYELPPDKLWW